MQLRHERCDGLAFYEAPSQDFILGAGRATEAARVHFFSKKLVIFFIVTTFFVIALKT